MENSKLSIDPNAVLSQAQAELAAEEHRQAVELTKRKLRYRKNFWVRIFPWRLRIERRELPVEDTWDKAHRLLWEIRELGFEVGEGWQSSTHKESHYNFLRRVHK